MTFFEQCVFCGGQMFHKDVELLLKGGDNVATITVQADVCLRCGHHLYDPQVSRKIDEIRKMLAAGETEEFQPRGRLLPCSQLRAAPVRHYRPPQPTPLWPGPGGNSGTSADQSRPGERTHS